MGPSLQDMLEWSEQIAASARTGLAFSDSLYERERYEEIMKIAARIRIACQRDGEDFDGRSTSADELFELWSSRVGQGIPGYVTPKVSVGAIVTNEAHEMLLVQRGDSGVWFYPTGWADVGYSPAEVVVKEVKEETGIDVRCVRVLGVLDGMRSGFTAIPMYSIVFLCQATGGELKGHPLETRDVGWFSLDDLPPPVPQISRRIPGLFEAIMGEATEVYFDPPRLLGD